MVGCFMVSASLHDFYSQQYYVVVINRRRLKEHIDQLACSHGAIANLLETNFVFGKIRDI